MQQLASDLPPPLSTRCSAACRARKVEMGREETGGTVSWVEEGLCLGTVTVSTCLCGNYVARPLLFSLLFYKNSSNVDLI